MQSTEERRAFHLKQAEVLIQTAKQNKDVGVIVAACANNAQAIAVCDLSAVDLTTIVLDVFKKEPAVKMLVLTELASDMVGDKND